MKFRNHYFKRESSLADSDTVIVDVNVKNPISAISIEYEITNGATSCVDHEIHDDVSAIELVDGSRVLWSLTMNQARALNFFETGNLPHERRDEGAGEVQEEKCVLHFGRFLDDPEYYIRPKDFNNLQLRLTHAFTISATAGFATGTGKVTIMARIIEEGATTYKGFLMAKEKVSYTSVTSGDKEVDLPKDYPYRLMLLQAVATTYRHDEVLTKHKLSIDADAFIPFNDYSEDIDDANRQLFGLVTQSMNTFSKDTSTFLTDVYNIIDVQVRAVSTADIAFPASVDAEVVTVGLVDFSTVGTPALQTTEDDIVSTVVGTQPYGCLAIPFGSLRNEADWLNAPSFGDIKLYSTQAVAAACAVVLQQLAK